MPAAWLLACLLACAWPAQALQLQLVDKGLTAVQAGASRQLLADASRRLPPAWAAALDAPILVEWSANLPARVHGRARSRRMLLDRSLLVGWMARPVDAGDAHPATRAALAAILHELAHFYDRSAAGGLSGDPRLLDLAGWQVSPLWFGLRIGDNHFSDRSPDRYELTSPVEFVAVNLEYFLLDPAYACRRPALYRYFSAHFGFAPPRDDCAPGLVYLQPAADAGQTALLQLDPERVYAVHFLLAEGNDRLLSRWGHSMLRLVVCAPGRPRGPDCLLDLQHHRVLSFRAFVDDVQISSWRGLTGDYPSRLFVLPLTQVIDEYTKVQLRGLRSIPLRLERAEISTLLQRAAKLHWSYDGRYYFLSNNCAVETFKLLHDGVPRLAAADLGSITPTGLLAHLREAGIADASVLDDPARARRLGYYFESMAARYQAMFDVARQALGLPQTRVQDWMGLRAIERAPWLEAAGMRAAAALLVLEHAALRRQQQLARDALKRNLLDAPSGSNNEDAPPARAAMQAIVRLQGSLSHPATLLAGDGYGLPQASERVALAQVASHRVEQWRRQSAQLHEQAYRLLSPQRQQALAGTRANIDFLGQRLRHLHREQGGLQLH